jgi:hypothetical protein
MGAENLATTKIQSPDRPAHSESLYRLSYPGSITIGFYNQLEQYLLHGRGWVFNRLPLLFKSLLPGQEDCVFFSGHLNLHAKPKT